jgi:S-adenosylmethionine:tRNA ribosyltransferase-isomerase
MEIGGKAIKVEAELTNRDEKIVRFTWSDNTISFAEIVEAAGEVPLPPYFQRKPIPEDKERYQTVYSKNKGAVAAPTAGLHFTNQILGQIEKKGHLIDYLTLHVSAGTFQPVKQEDATQHPMHSEQIVVTKENLENLIRQDTIVAVGTTSMRTLESLYWFAVKLMDVPTSTFEIEKLYPYQNHNDLPQRKEVFEYLLSHMNKLGTGQLMGETEIFILPGYDFKICDGLITNFHQPCSTLLMLIASFIGDDWKKLYQEALDNDYQFLSYGDSSLLLPK